MNKVTFKGEEVKLEGKFPAKEEQAPEFKVVKDDLSELSLQDLAGKKIVLNIAPSIDTGVCQLQLKSFSQKLSSRDDLALLFVSMDLPFALGRFCSAEGIDNAITASDFREHSLAKNYGVKITNTALAGLYARAVLVLDQNHKIVYSELVSEITTEPDYDKALEALKAL